MKKLISNNGGMKTFLEVREILAVPDTTYLCISTQYDGSKDPVAEQVKYEICLDKSDLANLKAVFNEML